MRQVCLFAATWMAGTLLYSTSVNGQNQAQTLSITNYRLVSEVRVSRTESYFTYGADLVNSGAARTGVTAVVSSLAPNVKTVPGQTNLHFSPVPANSQVPSLDSFTILVDRSVPFSFSQLGWNFNAPVANAGPNQTAGIGTTATLNGSGSTNPSGVGTLTYQWTFVSRPPGTSAVLLNATAAISSFVVDAQGTYTLSLTVSNGVGSDTATTTVSTVNSPPVANAGPAQTVPVGSTVTLNGSGSTDVDGDPLTYAWQLLTAPTGSLAVLSGPNTVKPTFIADRAGTYIAQLVVNDGRSNSAPSTVTITTANTKPVANAGPGQSVNVGNLVQLNGAGSTDVDGDPLTYSWRLITVPAGSTAVLNNAAAVNPTFTADRPGTYVAQLIVNDGKIDSDPSTVTITTNAVQPPTANAGPNQTVLHGTTVTLSGSGTDPQNLPLTLAWSLITKPTNSQAVLSGINIANPTFLADLPGIYVAQLVVNNGVLSSTPSTVTITTTNTAPVANPGTSQSVLAGATVLLNGSASSDSDNDPLTYSWTFNSRPAGSNATLNNPTSLTPSFIADLPGVYVVQLIVSDPFSSSVPATVTITATALTITLSPDPLNLTLSPGTLTVTLGTPAGIGGQVVRFAVLDGNVASMPAEITIPQNATGGNVVVTPRAPGSTLVTASTPGFRPGTATVNVGIPSITLTLQAGTVGLTRTINGTVTLSDPAPATGTSVALTANPPGIVTLQPSLVNIPAGSTTGAFTITGVAEGTANITGSSPGYATSVATPINVGRLGLIILQQGLFVAPGQTAPIAVSLATPAPTGGVTISLTSSDTSKLTVTPSVFIAQGATTPAASAQVTGVSFGSATVTASAGGFTGDSQTVTIGASLSFAPANLTLGAGASGSLTLNLSSAAPGGGLLVSLSSSNPAAATVPATANITAGQTSVNVPVTAVSPGSTTISATTAAPNVGSASAGVNVLVFGAINLPSGVSVGLGQSVAFPISLSSIAPAGGVTVTLSVSDNTKATLSSTSVQIPAGTTTPATQPQITGIGVGTANVNATAPGYGSASQQVQVTASLSFPQQSLNVQVGSSQNATLTLSGPAPVGGLAVNLLSNNTAIATVPANVIIPQGQTSANVPVTGVATGTATVRATATGITEANLNVNVQTGGVIGLPSGVSLAPGQTQTFAITLPSPAGSGGVTINLLSSDTSKVVISPNSVNVAAGQTTPVTQPQVQGVNFGSATISAAAVGYTSGSQLVNVGAALSFPPGGVSLAPGITQNITLTLSAAAPAGGLAVNLSSSNPAVATVPAQVTFAQGATTAAVAITGVGTGTSTINASSNTPNITAASTTVTVQSLGSIGAPATLAINLGQSAPLAITLPAPAPAGGVALALNSSDPSIAGVPPNVTIPAGQTQPTQAPQISGLKPGSATVTVSGAGYISGTTAVQVNATITFTPNTLTINGIATQNLVLTLSGPAPLGLVINLTSANTGIATVPATVTFAQGATTVNVPVTSVAAGTTTIQASGSGLAQTIATVTVNPPVDIILANNLTVAPGDSAVFPVTLAQPAANATFVNLVVSDPTKASLNLSSVFINAGQTQPVGQAQITGLSAGQVTVTASAPGLTSASTNVTIGFAFNFAQPTVQIVGTATENVALILSGPAPANGLVVTLTSTNPAVATIPPTVTFGANSTSVNVPITGVGPGQATIQANAAGMAQATTSVTVANPGTIVLPSNVTVQLNQSVTFPVTLSTPAGPGGVVVSLSSNNTGIVTISPATVTVPQGATTPATQPTILGVNVGAANITASATGYTSATKQVQVAASVTWLQTDTTIPQGGSAQLQLRLSTSAPWGAGLTVNLVSTNPAVAQVQPSVQFFPDGSDLTTVVVVVNGIAPGSAQIKASGINIPEVTTNVTVTGPLSITTSALPDGTVGSPYSQTLGAAGGTSPYSWVLLSGTFPNGLSVSASGQIAGTPTVAANNVSLTFRVTDSSAPPQTAQRTLTLTIVQPSAASISATAGTPQSTAINTAFAAPLVATVRDASNNPVPNATVTFTAPASGASGTFAGGVNTAVTNASGVATSAVFTANGTAGSYVVTASVAGVPTGANFALTNTAGAPGSITATNGTPQSAAVNTAFAAPLVATVRDAGNNPVANVTVTFTPPASGASGSFAGGVNTAVTNTSGVATSAVFTANATTGSYVVAASVSGVATPANFSLTNTAGAPGSITATSGTPQTTAVNTAFAAPLVATVRDSANNPVANVTVTFTAPASGASGSFAGGVNTAVTNTSGVATSAVFTANATTGSYVVTASAPGVATPANFSLTNTAGAAASITATSGTPQTTAVSTAFSAPLVATVRDGANNPVPNVTVTFTAPASGASGSFAGGVNTAVTDASGAATSAVFTANSTTGSYVVTASVAGVATPANFSLTNTAGAPGSITATGGTPQNTAVNTAFAAPLVATVRDNANNPVANVTVTFTPPASGASGSFAGGVNTAVTNASGVATSAVFTANGTTGSYVVTASAPGVAAPANFSLTNTAGAPASIAATSGTPQSTAVSTAFATPLVAIVRDAANNPVANVTVTFTAPASGASGSFAGGVSTAVTNASGVATSAVFTANATVGSYVVTASVAGVAAAANFALTNTAGAPASITATSGTPQTAAVNSAFAAPLVATVLDSGNNPVPNVTVTFTAPASGASGSFAGGANTAVTNASGVASSAVFTANGTAGSYVVTASVSGVAAPANFALTNTGGSPASITATSGTPQSATVGTAFAAPLIVTVRDAGNNPVPNVTVTFAAPASGASGTFAGGANTAVTNSSGVATSAVFTANTVAGSYTVAASVAGVATPADFALTNNPGPAASIAATGGTPQAATIGTAFAAPLSATVRDSNNNPVPNVTVTFTAPGAGASGTFAGGVNTAVTNASGVATSAVFSANQTAGSYVVAASAPGVGTPAGFALTNNPGPASSISATSGTPQSTAVGTAFALPLVATVRDAGNNPVPNVTVTFTAPASGASGTFAGGVNTAVTNASGVATSAVFTANQTAGSYNVTASVAGVGSPATFALTNTSVGGGASLSVSSVSAGNGLQAQLTVSLSQPAPAGGLMVTLTSADPTKLLLAGRPIDAGTNQVTFSIPAGLTSVAGIYAQPLQNSGAVNVTASASGVTPGVGTVTMTPAGFVLVGPNGLGVPSFTVSQGVTNTAVSVSAARLDSSNNFVELQPVRGGSSVQVSISNSNPSVGTVSPTSVTIGGGDTSATVTFNALQTGATTLSAQVPSGFSLPAQNGNNLTANVTPAGLIPVSATVGENLQTGVQVRLNGTAPTGGLAVTLTSNDPTKLILSTSATAAGSASITVTVPAGLNATPEFFLQALGNSGAVTYSATAAGFGSANGTVTLAPSGFVIYSPFGLGASFLTTSGAANSDLTIFSGYLDSGMNFVDFQSVRGGLSTDVAVVSSNPAVGTITASPLNFTGNVGSKATQFDPATAGTTTISLTTPPGFSTPAQHASITATVATPGIQATTDVAIGRNLQVIGTALLGQPAPAGGVQLTITSQSVNLKISSSETAAGANSATVTVDAGLNSATYYLQALSDTGSATYTVSAPGYSTRTATVFFSPSGIVIAGPFGFGFPLTTTVAGGAQPVDVFTARLEPGTNVPLETQSLAGGSSLPVTLNNSSPSVGTVPSTLTILGGTMMAEGNFTPLTTGQTIISVVQPSGYALPSSYTSLTAQVN